MLTLELIQQHIRNFCLLVVKKNGEYDLTKDQGYMLCLVEPGYFASTAWLESNEAFGKVSGRSFGIITGDDAHSYREDKSAIVHATSAQVFELLPKCCEEFRNKVNKRLNIPEEDANNN